MIPLYAAIAAALAGVLAAISIQHLALLTMVATTVVSGLVVYYFRFETIMWLPYVAAVVLFARFVVDRRLHRTDSRPRFAIYPIFIKTLLAYVAVLVVSTVANAQSVEGVIVGLKNYLPFWLVTFVVAELARDHRSHIATLERGALMLGGLQAPVVLLQAATTSNWDALVGTFGGDPQGGGGSGILMIFTIVTVLVAVHLWQVGALGKLLLFLALLSAGLIIALSEIKAVFLLLPVALLVQQVEVIVRRPLVAIAALVVVGATMWGLIGLYETSYVSRAENRVVLSPIESMERAFGYFLDPSGIDYTTGEVSRGASIALWLNDTQSTGIERVIGHGAGASRSRSTLAVGSVAVRFAPLNIASTAAAQLLWDTGLFGMSMFLATFVTGFVAALRLAKRARNAADRSTLRTITGLLAIVPPLLFYDRSLVDAPAVQLLYAVIIGVLLCYWGRLHTRASTSGEPSTPHGASRLSGGPASAPTATSGYGSSGSTQ